MPASDRLSPPAVSPTPQLLPPPSGYMGVLLFGRVVWQEDLNQHANFNNLPQGPAPPLPSRHGRQLVGPAARLHGAAAGVRLRRRQLRPPLGAPGAWVWGEGTSWLLELEHGNLLASWQL